MADAPLPLREFILGIGDMPWNGSHNNWGFGVGRDLSVLVPPPDDEYTSLNGIPLHKGYTYNDVAAAVEESALNDASGGNISHVVRVDVSPESKTSLIVEFQFRYGF